MDKKEVVITGATRGIGYFTAQHLVARGYSVSLVARDPVRLKQAQNHLKALADGATSVRTFQADLSSIAETKGLAATLRDELPTIDILLNNAGALFTKRYETPEGHEKTLALNHYAYFTLTLELLPQLRASKAPRIISVASDAHVRGRMHWEDLNFQKSYGFGGWSAYCQSKLANVLFVRSYPADWAPNASHAPLFIQALSQAILVKMKSHGCVSLWRSRGHSNEVYPKVPLH